MGESHYLGRFARRAATPPYYMPLLRALRSAPAVLWSACKSIDLEDCTLVLGYALLGYGCALIQPAYGYIVPGALIVLPRVLGTLLNARPRRSEGRWAA